MQHMVVGTVKSAPSGNLQCTQMSRERHASHYEQPTPPALPVRPPVIYSNGLPWQKELRCSVEQTFTVHNRSRMAGLGGYRQKVYMRTERGYIPRRIVVVE